ncbi:hypothetical protein [Chelatococcus reniformis]|uniref:Lipocalin-like domain-containing protein n=1 Tax=Chelatococcus reniformis TaxID=1494448 RepID=A0A916XEV4_9HYPH|nr:hypothetical protein [Chelatococcus reniformis]GGC65386.1 hypothetical protein GCM10010994_24970 [Chelatococcus reniformis]
MSILGKWRIVELPGYEDDCADMVEPAYILIEARGGAFVFGCVTGSFAHGAKGDAVEFAWNGNDEMDEASEEGLAELQPDSSLRGEISFHAGDDIPFVARPWSTSSTAC